MSSVKDVENYIFHSDLGPLLVEVSTVHRFDVEDIVRNRAISQARAIQFLSLGQQASLNDPKTDRTIPSDWQEADEELA